ncbi:baculoviral IAP repeat-containing protein 2-like isoform X1 [Dendropsophus ebraccatus]|uniref:baculoviral IAP repeat-containing protein 2-like isoform X1 n=1 Tax=Dendropsophus ebraccatus TaxID=150705 RepID=UPI0038320AB3
MSDENQIRIILQKMLNADKKKKKAASKAKAASQMDGGKAADQKRSAGAGTSSKPLESQKSGEDVKPKNGRKLKISGVLGGSYSMEKPIEKMDATGGAVGCKQKQKEKMKEDVSPRRTRRQPTRVKKHFVTTNRAKLIKLITHVEPVLDDLLDQKLLIKEQYDIIRKESTNQNKMRKLYDYVPSWGPKDNDKFLRSLKKHNPVPIKNLMKKQRK